MQIKPPGVALILSAIVAQAIVLQQAFAESASALGQETVAPPAPGSPGTAGGPALRYIDIYGIPGVGLAPKPDTETAPQTEQGSTAAGSAPGGSQEATKFTSGQVDLPPFPGEEKDKKKVEDKDKKARERAAAGSKKGAATATPGTKASKDKTKEKESEGAGAVVRKEPAGPSPAAFHPLRAAMFEMSRGHFEASVQTLDRFLADWPGHAQAHYLKAVALVQLRRYDDAAEEYRQVVKLDPGSTLAQRAADGLKALRQ